MYTPSTIMAIQSAFLPPAEPTLASRKPKKPVARSLRHLVFLAKLWAGLNKHIQESTGSKEIDAQLLETFGPWRHGKQRVEMPEDVAELCSSTLG